MKLVVIESPCGHKSEMVRMYYREYAKCCMIDSLDRGEAPFASHLLYTQVLDDTNAEERKEGIEAGLAWGEIAALRAVYTDLGVSEGMKQGIDAAMKLGQQIEYRALGGAWAK